MQLGIQGVRIGSCECHPRKAGCSTTATAHSASGGCGSGLLLCAPRFSGRYASSRLDARSARHDGRRSCARDKAADSYGRNLFRRRCLFICRKENLVGVALRRTFQPSGLQIAHLGGIPTLRGQSALQFRALRTPAMNCLKVGTPVHVIR